MDDIIAAIGKAAMYRDLRSKGPDIGVPDALIAGIALQYEMPLLRNVRAPKMRRNTAVRLRANIGQRGDVMLPGR